MLYQQGTQRIEVIVRKEGGTDASGGAGAKDTEATDAAAAGGTGGGEQSAATESKGMSARKKRFIRTNATHALATARQVADLRIEYAIGGIGYKNGDQALQDQVSRKVEITQDGLSLASSVGMGLAYGAAGGPLGMAIGAGLGFIGTAVSIGTKYDNRRRDYDWKMFKENNAIAYQRARAQINWTNGRLR